MGHPEENQAELEKSNGSEEVLPSTSDIQEESTVASEEAHEEQLSPGATEEDDNTEKWPWQERGTTKDLDGSILYEFMKDVTSRVKALEDSQVPEKEVKVDDNKDSGQAIKTIPKVRDCNWEQFKNRYSAEEATFCIETLLAGDDLDKEMEEEQLRRLPPEKKERFDLENRQKPARRLQNDKRPESNRIERVRINSLAILRFLATVTGETSWSANPHTFLRPFKILIHFHRKMEDEFDNLKEKFENGDNPEKESEEARESHVRVSETAPEDGSSVSQPDTVHQPSNEPGPSEGSEDKITSCRSAAHVETTTDPSQCLTEPAKHGDVTMGEKDKNSPEGTGILKIDNIGQTEYEEIKCYIEFAKARLVPIYHLFDNVDHSQRAKVRYADLWSLFRPGELVFEREDSKADSANIVAETHSSATRQPGGPRLWRVYLISTEEVDWVVDNLSSSGGALRRDTMRGPEDTAVSSYYIDFDGQAYSGVGREFVISPFDGEKEIEKLEIYPVRFRKDAKMVIQRLLERGQRFQRLLQHRHLAMEYDGWTLIHDPTGDPIKDRYGDEVSSAEYISSDVIIDFQEAFQTKPSWKPRFPRYVKGTFSPETEYDDFSIIQWSGSHRSEAISRVTEVIIEVDSVEKLEWNSFADRDDFMIDSEVRAVERDGAKQKLTPEDLALLPPRLLVYSLRDRRFVNADIRYLKELPVRLDPFNDLKIANGQKQLIRSTVQDHFKKKRMEREFRMRGVESFDQDFIRGKGKGLVILLHGAPGVGKTATAEAVAYAHQKPLFPITCGDLGIEPSIVESTLSGIFRLANLWDCVLLLDEADIFLSHREKKDDNLQRNALVSIFLRTLEYYPGILFLTTNRVGVLDAALSSRVHISMYFPDLDLDQTIEIFRMNLTRAEKIVKQRSTFDSEPELTIKRDEIERFAMEQFLSRRNKKDPWWNGRLIRNAFQVAMSLAYETKNETDPSHKYLGREHFERVLEIFQDYDRYRQDLFHKTDHELAEVREERHVQSQSGSFGARNISGSHLVYGGQNNRQYGSGLGAGRARGSPQSYGLYAYSSSGSGATPERLHDFNFPPQDTSYYTPTTQTHESPFVSAHASPPGRHMALPLQRNFNERELDENMFRHHH